VGIYLSVRYDIESIGDAAWAAAWDDVVAMLEAWPSRLLGYGRRTVMGVTMSMYTRSIRFEEKGARWCCVVGDRASLRTGESQDLSRGRGGDDARLGPSAVRDILCVAASRGGRGVGGLARAFGNKTQGHPFHYALLAAGMLLEERFPRSVYTSGDIDRDDAEVAARMAAPILGRTLAPPVCTDAVRLIARLRAEYADEALEEAAEELFCGEDLDLLEGHVRSRPGVEAGAWLGHALVKAKRDDKRDVTTLLVAWLNAGRSVTEAVRWACLDPKGPRCAPEDFVDRLAATWVALPVEARGPGAVTAAGDMAAAMAGERRGEAMATWMLDRAQPGRSLRGFEPPERVDAALEEVFGDAARALGERFREKTDAAKHELEKLAEGTAAWARRLFANGLFEECDALAVLASPESMSDACRSAVECLAWNVLRAEDELRAQSSKVAMTRDAVGLRRTLVRLKCDRSPTLTEEAWDHFLALDDTDELTWLVVLASLEAPGSPLSEVRRALFENHALRRWAMDVSRDAARMERVGEEIRRAKKAATP
jgi:hypothetical protein